MFNDFRDLWKYSFYKIDIQKIIQINTSKWNKVFIENCYIAYFNYF